jgi:ADP-heptose:LPS heptosyltransferase
VSEETNRAVTVEFLERNDVVRSDHGRRRQARPNRQSENSDMPKSSPSVLIIRLDAIGDALALTPLLAELRARAIPVDVVLRPGNSDVFASRAARRILMATFDLRSREPSNRRAIERLGEELASQNYTHALVATEDPGGYRLARATRATVRVGFSNAWGKPLKTLWSRAFLTDVVYRSAGFDSRAPHECEVLFALGSTLLGADAAPTRDVKRLRPLVLENEPRADTRVAVQITDKWERLGIAFEQVVEALQQIGALVGVSRLRLLAAANEGHYADHITRATGLEVERFTSIEPWKSAIAASPALVAPDSGALHVAGMVGTPIVALFPPARDFALQVARWAPWSAPYRIVRAESGWPKQAADALAQLL